MKIMKDRTLNCPDFERKLQARLGIAFHEKGQGNESKVSPKFNEPLYPPAGGRTVM